MLYNDGDSGNGIVTDPNHLNEDAGRLILVAGRVRRHGILITINRARDVSRPSAEGAGSGVTTPMKNETTNKHCNYDLPHSGPIVAVNEWQYIVLNNEFGGVCKCGTAYIR